MHLGGFGRFLLFLLSDEKRQNPKKVPNTHQEDLQKCHPGTPPAATPRPRGANGGQEAGGIHLQQGAVEGYIHTVRDAG